MMVTTHVLASLGVAVVSLRYLPGQLPPAFVLAAAVAGGLLPDLDLVAEHRKSLHYPAGYGLLAVVSGAGALLLGWTWLALFAITIAAAWLHSASEVLCGGPEREPWNPTTDRAVYNHLLGSWHRARRYVRYSGAPEDWLLGAAFGLVVIASTATPSGIDTLVLALIVLSGAYALVRTRLALLSQAMVALTPVGLRPLLPTLSVIERDSGGTTVRVRFRE